MVVIREATNESERSERKLKKGSGINFNYNFLEVIKMNSFAKELARKVVNGESDADSPDCPDCGSTMCFHGGDLELGDGYWECPDCGYSITEDDLEPYM